MSNDSDKEITLRDVVARLDAERAIGEAAVATMGPGTTLAELGSMVDRWAAAVERFAQEMQIQRETRWARSRPWSPPKQGA